TGTGSPPTGIGTSAGTGTVAGPAGTGRPGVGITPGTCPATGPPGKPGSWGTAGGDRCWPPTVDEPSGGRGSASGPDLAGAGGSPGSGCTRTGTSGGSTGGFGGGGAASESLVFSGGGGTPSAGLGVPTMTQLPDGSWIRCAVSLVGIMPCLRA